jgi:TonB-dependent SusC/RagA subfamily outer membrane receptor
MKNSIRLFLSLFLVVISITGLYGQKSGKKIEISGFVYEGTGMPVAKAVIMVDGEKTGDVTNSKGFYKIKVKKKNKKISVYYSADEIIEEEINGRSNIDFTLKATIPYHNDEQEEELVDIGYQKVKKKDLIVPVGQVDARKSKYAAYTNIYELIRGQVPGVQVRGTSIMIRSVNSATMDEPMFVVDGVPVNTIDNIDPQNVRSVEVLKGSAASIYGSRGSNGVILINLLK